jgi:hypothetical protein
VRELCGMLSTCRYCLRLNDAEVCRECLDHKETSGHFPSESFGGRSQVSRAQLADFAASAERRCAFPLSAPFFSSNGRG